MKNRKNSIVMLLVVVVVLAVISIILFLFFKNDNSYNKLYKTDIIGEWEAGEQHHITFSETECLIQLYGIQERGKYALTNISENFQYIDNDIFVPEYKYYNTIGNYYKTEEVPKAATFDFTVFSEESSFTWNFTVDGICKIYTKSEVDSDEYELYVSFKYYREKDAIYNGESKRVIFYIIEDGLYSPVYKKVK